MNVIVHYVMSYMYAEKPNKFNNGTVHKFNKMLHFKKNIFPLLSYVKAMMIVHVFDRTWSIGLLISKKVKQFWKSMSCSLVISQILAELRPKESDIKLLHN